MASIRHRDPQDELPLGNASFLILLALADGEQYGYAILKEVNASSNGSVYLGPGTLYRVLKQMVSHGWIAEISADTNERRRTYRILPWGLAIARAEATRLAEVVRLARRRQLLVPAT